MTRDDVTLADLATNLKRRCTRVADGHPWDERQAQEAVELVVRIAGLSAKARARRYAQQFAAEPSHTRSPSL